MSTRTVTLLSLVPGHGEERVRPEPSVSSAAKIISVQHARVDSAHRDLDKRSACDEWLLLASGPTAHSSKTNYGKPGDMTPRTDRPEVTGSPHEGALASGGLPLAGTGGKHSVPHQTVLLAPPGHGLSTATAGKAPGDVPSVCRSRASTSTLVRPRPPGA